MNTGGPLAGVRAVEIPNMQVPVILCWRAVESRSEPVTLYWRQQVSSWILSFGTVEHKRRRWARSRYVQPLKKSAV